MSAKQLLKRILWLALVGCAPVALMSVRFIHGVFVFVPPSKSFVLWVKIPSIVFEYAPFYAICVGALFLLSLVWWIWRFSAKSSCALLLMAFIAGPTACYPIGLYEILLMLPRILSAM